MENLKIYQQTKDILSEKQMRDIVDAFLIVSIECGLGLKNIRKDLVKGYIVKYFKNKNSHRFTIYNG